MKYSTETINGKEQLLLTVFDKHQTFNFYIDTYEKLIRILLQIAKSRLSVGYFYDKTDGKEKDLLLTETNTDDYLSTSDRIQQIINKIENWNELVDLEKTPINKKTGLHYGIFYWQNSLKYFLVNERGHDEYERIEIQKFNKSYDY